MKLSLIVFLVLIVSMLMSSCGNDEVTISATPTATLDYSMYLPEEETSTHKDDESPVYLILTDPDGLVISSEINEIPDSIFTEHDSSGDGRTDNNAWIPERKPGKYLITVIPKPWALPTDTFNIRMSVMEHGWGYTDITIAEDIAVSDIPDEPYIYICKERAYTTLMYKGDLSTYDKGVVNLSAVLLDEFGNPIDNRIIDFRIGPQVISGITDVDGLATASTTLHQEPEGYEVMVQFDGDMDFLPSLNGWYTLDLLPALNDTHDPLEGF